MSALAKVVQTSTRRSRAHTRGHVVGIFNVSEEGSLEVLLDTGALSQNFIREESFNSIKQHLTSGEVEKKTTPINLASEDVVVESHYCVSLKMKIKDSQGLYHNYQGKFIVLPKLYVDVIIGLPAILWDIWDVFVDVLRGPDCEQNTTNLETSDENNELAALQALMEPWEKTLQEEAPEDTETPLPAQFEFASEFLGKSREEALNEYIGMFESHITPEFREATNVEELLKTKGVKVFVPTSWDGIRVEPVELVFDESMPNRMKPRARPVNPRLFEAAEKEFKRLCTYFYEPSRSPWASCLVIAPKATKPFIRFCGDYVVINKYIKIHHYKIPMIRHELERIAKHKVFLDIDMTNSFHQIKVTAATSERLSVQTPWGQFQPKFVPEGIGPASFLLQEIVMNIFGDLEWAIVIFDNMLILADDYQDAYTKLEIFLDRCIEYNIVLKFAKSWLGLKEVNFFGYQCSDTGYQLNDDRKRAIAELPFPETGNRAKKVKSVLGSGVFFSPFVPNYSKAIGHLTDLTKPTFNWNNEANWKHDYRREFEEFKLALQKACTLYYPNYDLPWTLRTDASQLGVGCALIQTNRLEEGVDREEVIALASKKFSEQAQKWSTIEQEGYGMYYGVYKFSYYLRGKPFVLETDHKNLRWIEASEVPKIVRWRIYMQSFVFQIKDIPGSKNGLADAHSRLFLVEAVLLDELDLPEDHELCVLATVFDNTKTNLPTPAEREEMSVSIDRAFAEVHNGTSGHWGAKESWLRLSKFFPGHGLSFREVRELVDACPNCQKNRKERKQRLIPMIRTLKPPHCRSAIGIDSVAISPAGKNGETHILVIVNLFTKLTALYASTGCTASNLTAAVWQFWASYGTTDMIISDLGSDLTSDLFAELTNLVGVRHVFSIADKHANGVERVIKEVVRHLRAIVFDKRIGDIFADPLVIPTIQYILNSHNTTENGGYTPFTLTFGDTDELYTKTLGNLAGSVPNHSFLRRLTEHLKKIQTIAADNQRTLIEERKGGQRVASLNLFQAGDLVLFDAGPKPNPKLSSRFRGPFEVIAHKRNDVDVRDLIDGVVKRFSSEDLELFNGTRDSAYEAALRDRDQFVVSRIISYSGDSTKRTSMTFKVEFADGGIVDLPWSHDLLCTAYYEFCENKPFLQHLALDAELAKRFQQAKRKEPIAAVGPGSKAYIDLRFFGDEFYEQLGLPDAHTTSYVMEFKYTHWYHKSSKKRLSGEFVLAPNMTYGLDGYAVFAWGSNTTFEVSTMILVDKQLLLQYPAILA